MAGRKAHRNLTIAAAYSAGEKLDAIAALHGLTKQRVEQIARAMRCPLRRLQCNHSTSRLTFVGNAALAPPRVADLGERIFCTQCERRVRRWQANACVDRHCKAKVVEQDAAARTTETLPGGGAVNIARAERTGQDRTHDGEPPTR